MTFLEYFSVKLVGRFFCLFVFVCVSAGKGCQMKTVLLTRDTSSECSLKLKRTVLSLENEPYNSTTLKVSMNTRCN